MVGNCSSILVKCKVCRQRELTQEEQTGKEQNMKGLERHEKDFRVYSVANKECNLLKIVGWDGSEGGTGLL